MATGSMTPLSDEEFATIDAGDEVAAQALSDEEFSAIDADNGISEDPSGLSDALKFAIHPAVGAIQSDIGKKALGAVGNFVDSYTGAPTRSAIGSLQEDMTDLPAAGRAFANQFGEDPTLAPSGRDLAERAGATGVLADAAGLGLDLAADPTNLIPVGAISKLGGKIAGKTLPKAAQATKKFIAKGASTLTGVPIKEIETYAKNTARVDNLIKETGADVSAAADKIREGYQTQLQKTKSRMNSTIEDTLKKSAPDKSVNASSIVEELEKAKTRLDPDFDEADIGEIDDLVARIKKKMDDNGNMSVVDLNKTKQFLQDRASSAYRKDGQIFSLGKESQKAAKSAAAKARKSLNEAAPEIAKANNTLAALHVKERQITKSLIAPGKTDAALMAAGGASNTRNAKNLKDLSALTGYDFLNDAEILAAQRRFGNPEWLPIDTTGKSGTRLTSGTAIGGAIGSLFGATAPGAIIGGAMTSPAVLKRGIQAGSFANRKALGALNALGGPEAIGRASGELLEGARAARPLSYEERRKRAKALGVE